MKYTLLSLLSIGVLSVSLRVAGQSTVPNPPALTPKSPNTAAMEKYGKYEVDLFHGLPKISIPLYEIKTKSFTVPVTLDYHASGIKVADVATWVGLGWNLRAGGQISRNVVGKDDFTAGGYANQSAYFKSPEELNPNTPNGYEYLRGIIGEENVTFNDKGPDIFSLNAIGISSGQFFFSKKAEAVNFVPYQPYKLELKSTDLQRYFEVKDDKGNQFVFGKTVSNETVNEYSSSVRGSRNDSYASAWPLTEMLSADHTDRISFNYYPSTNYILLKTGLEDYVSVTDRVRKTSEDARCDASASIFNGQTTTSFSATQRLQKEIIFEKGKVEFLLSQNDRNDIRSKSLDRINIYNQVKNSYRLLKSVQFHYSYFLGDYVLNNQVSKLKLDSVTILSASGQKIERYRFDYNTPEKIQGPFSKSIDMWGYNNGSLAQSLIPKTPIYYYQDAEIFTTIGDANATRQPNPETAQECILKRIQYPTGGYTIFNYESNQYRSGGQDLIGGGLRIQSILSYPALNAKPIIKSYSYGYGYLAAFLPVSFQVVETQREYWYQRAGENGFPTGFPLPGCYYRTRFFGSYPSIATNDFDDSNVFYPNITEYEGTKGNNTGKTVYRYSEANDGLVWAIPGKNPYLESYGWKRGHLLEQQIFQRKSGQDYELVKSITNLYKTINDTTYKDVGILVDTQLERDGTVPEYTNTGGPPFHYPIPYLHRYYNIYSGRQVLESTVEKNIFNGSENVIQKDFAYNKLGFPILINTSKSNSVPRFEKYKYPSDYQQSNQSENAAGIKYLNDINTLATPIEYTTGVISGSNQLATGGYIKTFYSDKPLVKEEYFLEAQNKLPNLSESSVTSGNFIFSSSFKKRLTFKYTQGNVSEYELSGSGKKHAFIWDQSSGLLKAEAKNTSVENIAYTSFEDLDQGNWTYNENAVRELPGEAYGGDFVFDFSIGNQIVKSGLSSGVYIVTYLSKTPVLINGLGFTISRNVNSSGMKFYSHTIPVSTGAITVSSTSGLIDELRLYPFNAELNTYVQIPGIGPSAITNGSDHTSFYNYDQFQRLDHILNNKSFVVKKNVYQIPSFSPLGALPQYYFNQEVFADFKRNNCSSENYGTTVRYTVPAGSYISTQSSLDAQNQAAADIAANGQNNANLLGECRPKTEVVWEPIDLYCMTQKSGNENPPVSGYSFGGVVDRPDNQVIRIKIDRIDVNYPATVTGQVLFANGAPPQPFTTFFDVSENTKIQTVRTEPQLSINTNGAQILSVVNTDPPKYTGYKFYAKRQKRVGGEIVLTENNLVGIGQGPYYSPIRGDLYQECTLTTTSSGAYANNELYKEFVKNNCSGTSLGTKVSYHVPAGKYTSDVSQAAADQLALNEANQNGQAYANQNGFCYSNP